MVIISGNQINYPGDAGTPTSNLLTICKQCRINKERKDANDGPERLLPQHPDGTPGIHTNQDIGHTGGRHTALQALRHSQSGWVRLLLS